MHHGRTRLPAHRGGLRRSAAAGKSSADRRSSRSRCPGRPGSAPLAQKWSSHSPYPTSDSSVRIENPHDKILDLWLIGLPDAAEFADRIVMIVDAQVGFREVELFGDQQRGGTHR